MELKDIIKFLLMKFMVTCLWIDMIYSLRKKLLFILALRIVQVKQGLIY